ncbi:hypothetical protein DFH09DRAFT_1069186 [Mycena vulgaris]|nr:hypothetical protein DFH09DRAFT_1069186 [Mycena vulgaris]
MPSKPPRTSKPAQDSSNRRITTTRHARGEGADGIRSAIMGGEEDQHRQRRQMGRQYHCSRSRQSFAPNAVFHIFLRALAAPGDISVTASLVLSKSHPWKYRYPGLELNMQQSDVWSLLGRIALRSLEISGIADLYIEMGKNLKDTQWKSSIYQDLHTWINVFAGGREWGRRYHYSTRRFGAMIRKVWVLEFDEAQTFRDEAEKSWALALSALGKVWEGFEQHDRHIIELFRCTTATPLRVHYVHLDKPWNWVEKQFPSDCRAIFACQLGEALLEAAARMKAIPPNKPESSTGSDIGHDEKKTLERISDVLVTLGHTIRTELEPGGGEVQLGGSKKRYQNWTELQKLFWEELDDLEASLKAENVGSMDIRWCSSRVDLDITQVFEINPNLIILSRKR